jgi:hypothetical protein
MHAAGGHDGCRRSAFAKKSAKKGCSALVYIAKVSFCSRKLSQLVTSLDRGQVSRKITQKRFRRHLRSIEKHRAKAGFDICVVRPVFHARVVV